MIMEQKLDINDFYMIEYICSGVIISAARKMLHVLFVEAGHITVTLLLQRIIGGYLFRRRKNAVDT